MKKKFVLGIMVLLVIGGSVLYAQNSVALKSGAYRASYMTGEARILIFNQYGTIYVNVFDPDGTRTAIGTARIRGTQMTIDVGSAGFEKCTIVDDETFTTEIGITYYWVRSLRNNEVRTQW